MSRTVPLAHALTAVRLALVPVALVLGARSGRRAATATGTVLAVAMATDLLDGPAARRAGIAGPAGQLFDHTTDCLFVTGALAGASRRGAVPRALPVLVVASFVQYVADSRWAHHPGGLRRNRLGRVNGVLYFVPPALDVVERWSGCDRPWAARTLGQALVVTTLASMARRVWWVMVEARADRKVAGRPGRRWPGA